LIDVSRERIKHHRRRASVTLRNAQFSNFFDIHPNFKVDTCFPYPLRLPKKLLNLTADPLKNMGK